MGAYVYRLTSPKNTRTVIVDGVKHEAAMAIYAFKPSWSFSGEKYNAKWFGLCQAWTRSWEEAQKPKYVIICSKEQSANKKVSIVGTAVLESNGLRYFYDDPDFQGQKFAGYIQQDGQTIGSEICDQTTKVQAG